MPDALAPFLPLLAGVLAFGLFAAALAVALNVYGKRLDRHERLLLRLELRVDNLHRDHRQPALILPALRVRRVPPSLSEADTLEVTDDMLEEYTRRR